MSKNTRDMRIKGGQGRSAASLRKDADALLFLVLAGIVLAIVLAVA